MTKLNYANVCSNTSKFIPLNVLLKSTQRRSEGVKLGVIVAKDLVSGVE